MTSPSEPNDITHAEAERLLADWLGKPVRCERIEPLSGGMINTVLALSFDCAPHEAVLKLSTASGSPFAVEEASLRHMQEVSDIRVPRIYALGELDRSPGSAYLLIERLPGCNLGSAPLTPDDRREIEENLADLLVELHSHTGRAYCGIHAPDCTCWSDWFSAALHDAYRLASPRLPAGTRRDGRGRASYTGARRHLGEQHHGRRTGRWLARDRAPRSRSALCRR